MFIHHVATIGLMSFSWTCNFVRAGALVLITHDLSDIFMEAAKIAKYAGFQRVCDISFAVFFLVWVPTRLIIIPLMLYNRYPRLSRFLRISLTRIRQFVPGAPVFRSFSGFLHVERPAYYPRLSSHHLDLFHPEDSETRSYHWPGQTQLRYDSYYGGVRSGGINVM